jgi:hypothetical protein
VPPAPAAACPPEAAAAYAAFQRDARAAMILANLVFDQHSTFQILPVDPPDDTPSVPGGDSQAAQPQPAAA